MISGNPLGATTVCAETLAEGQMQIETYSLGTIGFIKCCAYMLQPPVTINRIFLPERNCRIAGIPGDGNVVFLY